MPIHRESRDKIARVERSDLLFNLGLFENQAVLKHLSFDKL